MVDAASSPHGMDATWRQATAGYSMSATMLYTQASAESIVSNFRPNSGSNEAMTTNAVTHRELDARLEAVDTRISSKFDRLEVSLKEISTSLSGFDARIENSLKSTKSAVWKGVAVMAGLIFAAFALSFQAFDSGRDVAALKLSPQAQQVQPIIINVPPNNPSSDK